MRRMLRDLAMRSPDKVFWADSRKRIEHFRRLVVKPNRQEADEACLRLFGTLDYQALRERLETRVMIVTQGPGGVVVVEPGRETPVNTRPVEKPVDICGAGDSFTAGAAMALAVTGSAVEAARFGNLVASVTIMKKGTGTASPKEVLEAEAKLG
jgi:sugar/nucleoside kinase (ribokinase family)